MDLLYYTFCRFVQLIFELVSCFYFFQSLPTKKIVNPKVSWNLVIFVEKALHIEYNGDEILILLDGNHDSITLLPLQTYEIGGWRVLNIFQNLFYFYNLAQLVYLLFREILNIKYLRDFVGKFSKNLFNMCELRKLFLDAFLGIYDFLYVMELFNWWVVSNA